MIFIIVLILRDPVLHLRLLITIEPSPAIVQMLSRLYCQAKGLICDVGTTEELERLLDAEHQDDPC
jgi:hypothetical protein